MGGTDRGTSPLHLPSTYVCGGQDVLERNHSRILDRQLISGVLLPEDILSYALKVSSCYWDLLNLVTEIERVQTCIAFAEFTVNQTGREYRFPERTFGTACTNL